MKKETLCQGRLSIKIRYECFDSAGMLTQSDFAAMAEPKARIQWFSECGVYFVQKSPRGGGGLMRE